MVRLAYPVGTGVEAMQTLERVAARYGVELVPLEQLQEAASRHGSPLLTHADDAPALRPTTTLDPYAGL